MRIREPIFVTQVGISAIAYSQREETELAATRGRSTVPEQGVNPISQALENRSSSNQL